jgi:hypothetical protein
MYKDLLFNEPTAVTYLVVYKRVWRSKSLFFWRVCRNAVRWEGGGSYHCLHSQTCYYRVLWLSTISIPCNMVFFGKGPSRRHRLFGGKVDYNISWTPSNVELYNERCYVLLYLDCHVCTQCQSLLPLLSRRVLQTWRLRYLLQEKQAKQQNLIQRPLTARFQWTNGLVCGMPEKKIFKFERKNLSDLNQNWFRKVWRL